MRQLLILFLGGCTTIGHQKVEGWPQLTVIEHHVPHYVMRGPLREVRAVGYLAGGPAPSSTSRRAPATSGSAPTSRRRRAFVKHERMHCEGYDHVGETQMRDFPRAANLEQTRAITLVRSPTQTIRPLASPKPIAALAVARRQPPRSIHLVRRPRESSSSRRRAARAGLLPAWVSSIIEPALPGSAPEMVPVPSSVAGPAGCSRSRCGGATNLRDGPVRVAKARARHAQRGVSHGARPEMHLEGDGRSRGPFFFIDKYGSGSGSPGARGGKGRAFGTAPAPRASRSHGEMVVAKLLARNGPERLVLQDWMSRARPVVEQQPQPKTWLKAFFQFQLASPRDCPARR